MKQLEQRIQNCTAKIGVIGLGYVGLPLALAFSEAGLTVLGFDIQQKRVNLVNRGQSYITDVSSSRLRGQIRSKFLQATIEQNRLSEVDVICICVPTPLTRTKDPDLSHVIHEAKEIAKRLKKGQLIVLESTTYPETTSRIVLPILESSNLKCGTDFYLAYSPERVDPGNKKFTISNTPKIVGGCDSESTGLAQILYSKIADTVVPVSCPEVAELSKIFENVFRSVNIALVNELAQLCNKMKISVWEVIAAAATKPFGYMPFNPGPGIGGHCIPLDPYYLASKAREFDFHTRFIELAAEINEHMPYYVVNGVVEALNSKNKSLQGAKVLVLGVAYKKDIDDIRESPSLKIIRLLHQKGAEIWYHDPYVPEITIEDLCFNSIELNKDVLASADCVLIATDHGYYDIEEVVTNSRLVFDTRGVTVGLKGKHIRRLGE